MILDVALPHALRVNSVVVSKRQGTSIRSRLGEK